MTADFMKAKAAVADILEKYKMKDPPVDPEYVAKSMGVDVVYADFRSNIAEKISGFIHFDGVGKVTPQIVVNKELSGKDKIFTIAHELAHFVLHRHDYIGTEKYTVMPRCEYYQNGKPKEEKEADYFAANLLVPDFMLEYYKHYATVKELSGMFAVSEDVIRARLSSVD